MARRLASRLPVVREVTADTAYAAEDYETARRYFGRSLALNPDYGLPKSWLARVNAEQDRLTT